LFVALRRIFGKLTYPYDLVELEPGAALARDGYVIETFAVAHGVSAVGYAIVEHERPGRFDVEAAARLAIPVGPERGALQAGRAVTLADGRTVAPEEVLGRPRPGRKLALTGDTAPSSTVVEAVRGADVLVHEATFLEDERDRARETMHSTALDAAVVAREAEAGMLALTHLSNRYFGRDAEREARTVFRETVVPRDFDIIELGFEERGGPRFVKGGGLHRREQAKPVEEAEPIKEHAS
jgi:ribonuclease Z